MAEVLSVPFKKPSDVDVVKPLQNLIASTYSTADKPEDYSEQIQEFSKLRSNAVWKVFEKYESSLEVIYRYYDQLHSLEAKIPPTDVQIPFKWKDAFNKGSLFGGKNSLTISSLSYERMCVLFNIAALQSAIAANQSLDNDEGLKLAAKLFQQASGIYAYMKNTVIGAIQVEPTPDLNPEMLGALSTLLLAQAQEVFVLKAIHDVMKEAIIAKLCAQCAEFYAEAMMMLQKDAVRNSLEKDWVPLVAGKQASFIGLAHYFQSIVCKDNKAIGEEISRLQKAVELLKCGQQRSGRSALFSDYVTKAEKALGEAIKDNDFIYHDRVIDPKFLPPIPRATLAKQTPLPQHFSNNFKDLFEGLVPMPVHQAMAAYEVRKAELINREINELRTSTQLLNGMLASLNLPAALEETSGETVPPSLVEKSAAIHNLGGVKKLESMVTELPQLLQRNTEVLNETEKMLDEEQNSDMQLKEQFKESWNRTPSSKLTETFRSNINKYKEIIQGAVHADKVLREKFDSNKNGLILLDGGISAMKASLPQPGGCGKETPASQRLRTLMEQVETLKAERDAIECELKSDFSDMKEVFLSSLADHGNINEPAMSTEALGRVYGHLQQQVKDSINRQQDLLAKIKETNDDFMSERSGNNAIGTQRESVLKELALAYDAFIELEKHLNEGTKFYNDLTQILVVFQNKVSDYCFARKTEKEELLKDLTQNLSRGPTGISTPSVPEHHKEMKKEPPPRPPPPVATAPGASLPYPTQPMQAMPMPYAPPPNIPYPQYAPPLPAGYNPYATIAGYPQHQQATQYPSQAQAYAPQQFGQFQPGHYGTYPGSYGQGQQPGHQPPQW